ncbi:AMP-binding protein [Simiduia curdlanivorans]|uniref:AMP-binding protein n=1 Tax=Simiduia curdlanivorans TaxID=1492769 RepID=A0ABV8V669_9GAMM|nr:AMP-binding protein [Simiduia curdlanivorans]MDN3638689.1 AMP-binding protein [Simiduia curdlanivorans]
MALAIELAPTPLEKFYHWEKVASDAVFLRQSRNGQWLDYTWSEVSEMVRRVAGFIASRELEPGARIGLVASNCAEWMVIDLAIMLAGHVSVPLYAAQDLNSGRYILDHAEVSLVFIGRFAHETQADELFGSDLYRIGLTDCRTPCDISLVDILLEAPRFNESPVYPRAQLFTLIYTSGTTGNPKGVMHNIGAIADVVQRRTLYLPSAEPGERERFISYLPLAHVAERAGIALRALYGNAELAFSAGQATFAMEMRQIKPTGFFAVPRLWEKFRENLLNAQPDLMVDTLSETEKLRLQSLLGLDKARYITTGAAATPPELYRWYKAIGIRLINAYGMTENLIDGCLNISDAACDPGCVGKPLPGVKLRFTEDGEVCFKSAGVMAGYYKDEEKSSLVLHDGWYHTGDRGFLDEEGRLVLTGRVGDIFKTGKGKFVNPLDIEHKLYAWQLFEQVCVVGQGLAQPVAILVPNLSARKLPKAQLEQTLRQGLVNMNSQLAPHERVSNICIASEEWSADSGLLTPTLKIKRQAVADRYLGTINLNCLVTWL